ncbi:hypothetical protein YB2330_002227 [Saitoella coloradoensis]
MRIQDEVLEQVELAPMQAATQAVATATPAPQSALIPPLSVVKDVPGLGLADHAPPSTSSTTRRRKGDGHVMVDTASLPSSGTKSENGGAVVDPLERLSREQREAVLAQSRLPEVTVNYRKLYSLATPFDWLLIIVGTLCSIAAGAALPLMTIVFGGLTNSFSNYFQPGADTSGFQGTVNHYSLYFLYIAIGVFFTTYIYTCAFLITGENITRRIREKYLQSILRQNVAYFDVLGAGEVTTRITSDMNLIQDGISEKVGVSISAVATFFSAFVIAFIKSWKLTLILFCIIPSILFIIGSMSKLAAKFTTQALNAYSQGGTLAEEAISSIRAAQAFGIQDRLANLYASHLSLAESFGMKKAAANGAMYGGMFFIIYSAYGLAFWEGSRLLVRGEVDTGIVVNVFFSVLIGAFSLGNLAPNLQAFSYAVGAGKKIFEAIERVPSIDSLSDGGVIPQGEVKGNIDLEGVTFVYPTRPEVTVMEDYSLHIPSGKTTALVGSSGSGKSTIVGLIERFYDPCAGRVLIDGHDIKALNVKWLRTHLSLVSQEPTLFATTIYENVVYGLTGTRYEDAEEGVKREMVVKACILANADGFVRQLTEGYDTMVGERAMLLSGGQKQRIAIARAVVSDPKVLLLDEATSALDANSEGVVQDALDKASIGRTTVVIAHRLATIRKADNIVVMAQGKILEQGTHDSLLEMGGTYARLVDAQRLGTEEKEKGEEDVEQDEVEERIEEGLGLVKTRTHASIASQVLANKKGEEGRHYGTWELIKRIGAFNKREAPIMFLGLVASVVGGGAYPAQAIIFAHLIEVLSYQDYTRLRNRADFFSLMWLVIAIIELFAYALMSSLFGYCSEKMVRRVRDQSFRAMLRQDISFFDKEENSTGGLTSMLSTDATKLAGLSGTTLGTLLIIATNLISGCILALVVGWKLALVAIATLPLLVGSGFLRMNMLAKFQDKMKGAYNKAAQTACEATSAIRTVASLTREQHVWDMYHDSLEAPAQAALISTLKSTVWFAASSAITFCCNGLAFWYGATLIRTDGYSLITFFICFTAITFGSQSAGQAFTFAPDMTKAKAAGASVMDLLDRTPEIDTWSDEGKRVDQIEEGYIEFKNVHFRYPTRPEVPVLRGLNLKVKPGQFIALVGPSGCGKSTTIGLIERFYEPLAGHVQVDGIDISTYNVNDYRRSLALVSQEPTLYAGSVKFNVILGAIHDVTDEEIQQACRDANIHDFIMSLPNGYDTLVGNKGSSMSGGQKQRIAIARALIRNPKILLLDEATSALDSESEKVVQAALDKAAKGRTTIAIAHRLATIQKADMIYVISEGRVAEKGTHEELLGLHGRYYEMAMQQQLEKLGASGL